MKQRSSAAYVVIHAWLGRSERLWRRLCQSDTVSPQANGAPGLVNEVGLVVRPPGNST